MTGTAPLKDDENLARLEALRPVYESLREARIRAEGDVRRYEREAAEARRAAEEELGTSDLAEIRAMIERRRAENTRAVDEFEAALGAVQDAVAALGQE